MMNILTSLLITAAASASLGTIESGPRNLVVTMDTVAANGSPWIFVSAHDAFAAVTPVGTTTIRFEPGVYWLDDPDDTAIRRSAKGSEAIPYGIEVQADTLHLIGLGEDASATVLAAARGQTQGAMGNFTMIGFTGKALSAENLTLGNYCNVDLDYPRRPELGRPARAKAIVQAQLAICHGTDRVEARGCRFVSRLNLCPLVGARYAEYDSCHFESTDDALCGAATYRNCHFTFFSSKPFYTTDPRVGATLIDCDIDLMGRGSQFLCKVPGPVTLIRTHFQRINGGEGTIAWTPAEESTYSGAQYGVTLDGIPYTLGEQTIDLTGSTILQHILEGNTDATLRVTAEAPHLPLEAKGDTIRIKLTHYACGGIEIPHPDPLHWSIDAPEWAQSELSAPNELTVVSANDEPAERRGTVTLTDAEYGIKTIIPLTVKANLREAPALTGGPEVKREDSGLLADYTLAGEDASAIRWMRILPGGDTVAVRHGIGATGRVYPLSAADSGCRIVAEVTPRLIDSYPGASVRSQPVSITDSGEETTVLATDFSEIPAEYQPIVAPGVWTFDGFKPEDTAAYDWEADPCHSWTYGVGVDGAKNCRGLLQTAKGARLRYTPARHTPLSGMTLTLDLAPCKPAGQGFGSASGQYMEVMIHYDTATRSGIGVRIERTPSADRAVSFTPVRHLPGGKTVKIGDSVYSTCFRAPMQLTVSTEPGENALRISGMTSAPEPEGSPNAVPSVELNVPINIPGSQGIAIQHTGSVGASATVITGAHLHWSM